MRRRYPAVKRKCTDTGTVLLSNEQKNRPSLYFYDKSNNSTSVCCRNKIMLFTVPRPSPIHTQHTDSGSLLPRMPCVKAVCVNSSAYEAAVARNTLLEAP